VSSRLLPDALRLVQCVAVAGSAWVEADAPEAVARFWMCEDLCRLVASFVTVWPEPRFTWPAVHALVPQHPHIPMRHFVCSNAEEAAECRSLEAGSSALRELESIRFSDPRIRLPDAARRMRQLAIRSPTWLVCGELDPPAADAEVIAPAFRPDCILVRALGFAKTQATLAALERMGLGGARIVVIRNPLAALLDPDWEGGDARLRWRGEHVRAADGFL